MRTHPLLRWWPAAAAAVVALAVLATLFAVVSTGTVAGTPACLPRVDAFVDDDAAMTAMATALRDDQRVTSLTTQTQKAAYARFRELYADHPEVLENVRPEDFPASVHVILASGTDPGRLVGELRAKFAGSDFDQPECLLELPPSR